MASAAATAVEIEAWVALPPGIGAVTHGPKHQPPPAPPSRAWVQLPFPTRRRNHSERVQLQASPRHTEPPNPLLGASVARPRSCPHHMYVPRLPPPLQGAQRGPRRRCSSHLHIFKRTQGAKTCCRRGGPLLASASASAPSSACCSCCCTVEALLLLGRGCHCGRCCQATYK